MLILLQKTNADWWSVRKLDGSEGYAPANYVKEVEPKIVQKKVKRRVKVPEKVMVTKTGTKKELQKKKKPKRNLKPGGKVRRTPSGEHYVCCSPLLDFFICFGLILYISMD